MGYTLTPKGTIGATGATGATGPAGIWAVIIASGDQAGIDETATPDLVSAFDTVHDGSASHGITVSAGVVTLPANSSGMRWEIEAKLVLTHSAAGTAQFRFYEAPSGANTAIGLTGLDHAASDVLSDLSGGNGVGAIAWPSGATTIGLRCTSTTSTNTVTLESEWSYLSIREVKA